MSTKIHNFVLSMELSMELSMGLSMELSMELSELNISKNGIKHYFAIISINLYKIYFAGVFQFYSKNSTNL